MTPAKRKEYDEVRKLGPMARGMPGGFGGGSGGGTTFRIDDLGDLGDLFGGLGNFGPLAAGRGALPGPRRGEDVHARIHLSFEDAIRGATTAVHVDGEARCDDMSRIGRGAGYLARHLPAAAEAAACSQSHQGLFSLSTHLPAVQRARDDHRRRLPHVQRHRRDQARSRGEGEDPARSRRRADASG